MSAEDQIRQLKQIPLLTKEEKRKKLMTAVVLLLSTLISVLFLVYAFIQKTEADKNANLSIQLKIQADQMRVEAERQRIEAVYAQRQAIAAREEADKQRALAMEALENC